VAEQLHVHLEYVRPSCDGGVLVLLLGPPASGKSTCARALLEIIGDEGAVIVRGERGVARAAAALDTGSIVIVDQCNVKLNARAPYLALADSDTPLVTVMFDFSSDNLKARLEARNEAHEALEAEGEGGGSSAEEDEDMEDGGVSSNVSEADGSSEASSDSGGEDSGSEASDDSEGTCFWVPPVAQDSLLRRSEALVNEELARVGLALVVCDVEGASRVFEVSAGGLLALSGSFVGRHALAGKLLMREGAPPTPLDWVTWGGYSLRDFRLNIGTPPAELNKMAEDLKAATGLIVLPFDERGVQRLNSVMQNNVIYDLAAVRELAQHPAVLAGLALGGMTHTLEFLEDLKARKRLLALFVARYHMGAFCIIHRDVWGPASHWRFIIKCGTVSGAQKLCNKGGVVANVIFEGTWCYGAKKTDLSKPHAAPAATDSTSVMLDFMGSEAEAMEMLLLLNKAIAEDGAAWDGQISASIPPSQISGRGAVSYSPDAQSKGGETHLLIRYFGVPIPSLSPPSIPRASSHSVPPP
jgi:energy-coupling factor transporter ATP-binding protein EcfA2